MVSYPAYWRLYLNKHTHLVAYIEQFFTWRIMRCADEVAVGSTVKLHITAFQFRSHYTSRQRVHLMSAHATQFDWYTIDKHFIASDFNLTETEAFLDSFYDIAAIVKCQMQFVQLRTLIVP